jgi:hypothetical protein
VAINPLSAIFGQWGANFEYSLGVHHSVVVSWAYLAMDDDYSLTGHSDGAGAPSPPTPPQPPPPSDADFAISKVRGWASEVGYRFYFDQKEMRGLFVSPSFLFASGTAYGPAGTRPFHTFGGAFDLGGQMVTPSGFVVCAGLGVYGTAGRFRTSDAAATWTTSGFAPRLLFSVGWAI